MKFLYQVENNFVYFILHLRTQLNLFIIFWI